MNLFLLLGSSASAYDFQQDATVADRRRFTTLSSCAGSSPRSTGPPRRASSSSNAAPASRCRAKAVRTSQRIRPRDRGRPARVLEPCCALEVEWVLLEAIDEDSRDRTATRPTCGCRRRRSSRNRSRGSRSSSATSRTSSPAAFACASHPARRGRPRATIHLAPSSPKRYAAADLLAEQESRRDRPLPVVARASLPRLAPAAGEVPRDQGRADGPASTGSSGRTARGLPVVRVINGWRIRWPGSARR